MEALVSWTCGGLWMPCPPFDKFHWQWCHWQCHERHLWPESPFTLSESLMQNQKVTAGLVYRAGLWIILHVFSNQSETLFIIILILILKSRATCPEPAEMETVKQNLAWRLPCHPKHVHGCRNCLSNLVRPVTQTRPWQVESQLATCSNNSARLRWSQKLPALPSKMAKLGNRCFNLGDFNNLKI